jgi:hypothetical protein
MPENSINQFVHAIFQSVVLMHRVGRKWVSMYFEAIDSIGGCKHAITVLTEPRRWELMLLAFSSFEAQGVVQHDLPLDDVLAAKLDHEFR